VSIDATKLSSIAIPVFDIAGLAQYDPLQAGLEVAWENAKWKLALGATWKHWSDYPGPLEPTLPDLEVPKPAYSDTVVPRVGLERSFALGSGAFFHARGGYFFEPTPVGSNLPSSQKYDIPTQTLVSVPTRYFDADRHVFTAGLGVSVLKPIPFSVDTFAQVHILQPRTMTLDAGEPDGSPSKADISGSILVTGIQVGVGF
jgi:long-chain fatty acid transport protein